MFNFDIVTAHQEFCDAETPDLNAGDEIQQVFTSLEKFLYRIELLFSPTKHVEEGVLCFELHDGDLLRAQESVYSRPLVSGTVETSRLCEGGWRSFEFSPLPNSQGKIYTIFLKMMGPGKIRLRKMEGIGDKYAFCRAAVTGALAYRAFAVRDFNMYENFKVLRREMRDNSLRVNHKPVMLRVEISKVCNQKCIMCAHGQDGFRLEKTDTKNMSIDVFEKVVAPLLPTTSVLVAFGLGEPFLNKDLMSILKRAKTINPLTHIFISTNGTRLSDDILREIVVGQLIDVLQISIDGASEETYAKIRKRAKEGNDYLVAMDALKRIIKMKREENRVFPQIKVEMLVTQYTAKEIFLFVEQMTLLGVNMIVLDSVKGDYSGLELAQCDIQDVSDQLRRARDYAASAGVLLEGPLFNEVAALSATAGSARAGVF